MSKHILIQYTDMQKEISEIENRIKRLTDKLNKIRQEGNVKDAVKGGEGGLQTFRIQGYPVADDEETEYNIKKNVRILKDRKLRLQELVVEVEEFLNTLDDSRMRRMITLKYIEGKTWYQVANIMGKTYTEDSCQKQMERFFKNL